MDEFYHSISKGINTEVDRENYTKLYNFVRESIIDSLMENEIFYIIYADLALCGSYADHLKVTKPNEFDAVVIVRFEFPFHEYVDLEEDSLNIGNVLIDLTNVYFKVNDECTQNTTLLLFLGHIMNRQGYLYLDRFQSWFEGILTKYLTKINHTLTYCNNEQIILKYKKQGPAHTITFKSSWCREVSIDFVPGFRFSKSQSITPNKDFISEGETWEAIPYPADGKSRNISFQCSYSESERRLIKGNKELKNALRMMKKFRDLKPELVNLKSHFIKSLFLGHRSYPKGAIMSEMFGILELALLRREIPFFWDDRVNLLGSLSYNQIDFMYREVRKARIIVSKRSDSKDLKNIKNLFLTQKEQNAMPQSLEKEIQRHFWDIAKHIVEQIKVQVARQKVQAETSYLSWIVGIAAGALVLGAVLNRWGSNN